MLELDPEGLCASFYAFQSLLQRQGWKTLICISKNPGHIHRTELHGCAEKFLQTEETASGASFHSEELGSKAFFQMKSLSSGASFQVFRAVFTSALGGIIYSRNCEFFPKNRWSCEKGIMIVATRGNAKKAATAISDHSETRAITDHDVDMVLMREDSYSISDYLARISQYEEDGYLATV